MSGLLLTALVGAEGLAARPEKPSSQEASPVPASAAPPPTPKFTATSIASYTLEARLDATSHEVTAQGSIRWTNPSRVPADELYFHLYLNAFEHEKTLFMRGPQGGGRSKSRLSRPGRLVVERLSARRFPGVDLWESAAAHSPGDPNDRTDIRVPLPAPVAPGETIELDVEFRAVLPQVVERTGFVGDFHLVAQWFPKLAKREPDGTWAHFPFHSYAEFYADFGDYDVVLDVPAEHVVGSTGVLEPIAAAASRRRYRAVANGVVDFAWTSWPEFTEARRIIGSTELHYLGPPNAPLSRAAALAILPDALAHFENAYGPYPYPALTVVHPPANAQPAGGMEYPSFITTGGSDLFTLLGIRSTELVTAHELAHQWFQSIIATNEVRYPFLDEGLTSYAEWRFMDEHFGPGSLASLGTLSISRSAAGRFAALGIPGGQVAAEPIAQGAAEFDSFRSLGTHVYAKTALSLETLAGVYGRDRLEEALRSYALAHRFAHPVPESLLESLERHLGSEARVLANVLFYETPRIDLRVAEVTPRRGGYDIVVARDGNLPLPFEVKVQLGSGRSKRQSCAQDECRFSISTHDSLSLVQVDPDLRIPFDEDLFNNIHRPHRGLKVRSRAAVGWLWQVLLQVVGP